MTCIAIALEKNCDVEPQEQAPNAAVSKVAQLVTGLMPRGGPVTAAKMRIGTERRRKTMGNGPAPRPQSKQDRRAQGQVSTQTDSRIEVIFGRPRDGQMPTPGQDRCPRVFCLAIALADTIVRRPHVLVPVDGPASHPEGIGTLVNRRSCLTRFRHSAFPDAGPGSRIRLVAWSLA